MKHILIVEDEIELAENLKELLENLGFFVHEILDNAKDTLNFLKSHLPDLILMDILIKGDIDGVKLTEIIKKKYSVPVLLLTAYSEKSILDKVLKINHDGFLLKPFSTQSLITSIYLASKAKLNNGIGSKRKKLLKIRDKGFLVPIPEDTIYYLQADGLYTKIFTENKIYIIRDILKDIKGKLSENKFVRVHKSYIININHVDSFNSRELIINKETIPIRRGFYKRLKEFILS